MRFKCLKLDYSKSEGLQMFATVSGKVNEGVSTNGSLVANVGGLLSEETLIKRILLVVLTCASNYQK